MQKQRYLHCTHIISASIKIYCPCPHHGTHCNAMPDLHAKSECQSPRLHVTMCVACSLSFPYLYKEGRRRLDIEGVGEYNGAMSPPERRHELLSWFWSSSALHQLYHRKLNATKHTKYMARKCVTFITPGCKTFIIIHKALIRAPELLICILRFTQ